MPRCWSPDVLQVIQAAPPPFPLRLADTALRNGETDRSGTCQRHMAPSPQVQAYLAAAATCEPVQEMRLHTG